MCLCLCVCEYREREREREVYCFPEVWFVGRKQGRQNKRREDNIREWAGLEFAKSRRAVENREKTEETSREVICGAQTTPAVKG